MMDIKFIILTDGFYTDKRIEKFDGNQTKKFRSNYVC